MKAWELLSEPGKWTQGWFARDANGIVTIPRYQDAVCWCAQGAIFHCYNPSGDAQVLKLESVVGHIPKWNDAPERTHAEVVAVLKELDI